MVRIITSLFLIISYVFTLCPFTCAETDHARFVREHLKEHSCIPDYVIDEMVLQEFPAESERDGYSTYNLRMFAFECKSSLSNQPLISVWVDQNQQILHCTCDKYTIQDYMRDAEYYYAVKSSVQAAAEWEKLYGPVQEWDAERYLQFLEQYHQIPNIIEDVYYNSGNYSLTGIKPTEDDVSVREAREISDRIVCEHLGIAPETLSALTVGSTYDFDRGPSYAFHYYRMDEKDRYDDIYQVFIRVSDGICLLAVRNFSDEEQEELRLHPEKLEEITNRTWWSDLEDWKSYFGW